MNTSKATRIATFACALLMHAGVASPGPNYSGIWWRPSESGWGIVVEHQIDVIFGAWLTYDARSQPTWFFLPAAARNTVVDGDEDSGGPNSFSGDIYRSHASAVEAGAVPNFPASVEVTAVDWGAFFFDWNPVFATAFRDPALSPRHSLGVTRLKFGERLPECSEPFDMGSFGNLPLFMPSKANSNLQGLWWNSPAGSESGWGVYVAQQGDLMLAIWLTYSSAGDPEWFSMELRKVALNTYRGPIVRSTGPSHESLSFDPARVTRTRVGLATLAFSDYFNGTFAPRWDEDRGFEFSVKKITRLQMTEVPVLCR